MAAPTTRISEEVVKAIERIGLAPVILVLLGLFFVQEVVTPLVKAATSAMQDVDATNKSLSKLIETIEDAIRERMAEQKAHTLENRAIVTKVLEGIERNDVERVQAMWQMRDDHRAEMQRIARAIERIEEVMEIEQRLGRSIVPDAAPVSKSRSESKAEDLRK